MTDRAIHEQAMKRFAQAKAAWRKRRDDYAEDNRFVNKLGGQWDKTVADLRKNEYGEPTLEFNELHVPVQQIVNRSRQERPQPKISPSDEEATVAAAEFWESRIRHIWQESQGDVACDGAVECAATGGFGFMKVETAYVDDGAGEGDPSPNQEPRLKRIVDPLAELPDPKCLEPDYSDAQYWFSSEWVDRDSYKDRFNRDPIPFPFEGDRGDDWSKEDQVRICQYWTVEETERQFNWYDDGSKGYRKDFTPAPGTKPIQSRQVKDRKVTCYLIDGAEVLETKPWLGNWIPRIPVLGREAIVDGERELISVVRFARDAQRLENIYQSNIAGLIQLTPKAPWIGAVGQFKTDRGWQDANRRAYSKLEYDPISVGAVPAPPPQRNTFEAPIQALSQAALQQSDAIRRAVGYSDAVIQPSKAADLSGVAIQRRSQQTDLTNYHIQDNLARAQWHLARILIDLDMKLADTPRLMRGRKEDGTSFVLPVTTADEQGNVGDVPGHEGKPHLRTDLGKYGVTISTEPGYASKREEERTFLMQILQADPAMWVPYADLVFEKLGYEDLKERAKLMLPPQITQSLQGKDGQPQINPQQMAQLAAQNQQLKQALQQLITERQSKLMELQARIRVAEINQQGAITVQGMKSDFQAATELLRAEMDSVEQRLTLLHESELAPNPATGPQGIHPDQPPPQPTDGAPQPPTGATQ